MSAGTASALPLTAPPSPRAQMRWRIVPAIDRDPRAVAAVQGGAGRAVLVAAVTVLAGLLATFNVDLLVAPLAALCAYAGTYRRHLISLATLLLLYRHGFWIDAGLIGKVVAQEGLADRFDTAALLIAALATVVVSCVGLLILGRRSPSALPIRHPTLCLICAFLALAAAAELPVASGAPRVLLWSLLLAFQPFLWFLAYALADRQMLARRPVWQHLGVFHPFWGSSMTPFGKGLSYLERYEAKTAEDLAVTQLKGVKLACWTLLLAAALHGVNLGIHGLLGVPRFDRVFLDFVGGARDPRAWGWASLLAFFVVDLMRMTIWGGAIVACARLAGFRLLRNTYKPMAARTLAEFWNRYYFFYKELLVDHFFYPTFFRVFRKNRRLRIFFATFMAACVGNLLFHFIRDIRFVAEMGWWRAVSGEASHALYTVLLAVGVGISQARNPARAARAGWLRGRVLPCLWVILFFCILHVFDAPLDRHHTIGQRAHFLAYLLGVDAWI